MMALRGALIVALVAGAACGGGPDAPDTFEDPSAPIRVRAGDEFVVALDSNPSTGYSWRLGQPPDERVVRLVSSTYMPPANPVPGAAGREHWRFAAVAPGQTQIGLDYVRPFEPGVPPARTVTFSVEVR